MSVKQPFRNINQYEKDITERLLEIPFIGSDKLKGQIDNARVRLIEEYRDNYGSVEFELKNKPKPSEHDYVPVTAMGYDDDKSEILFVLHVIDDMLNELEIVRLDGQPLDKLPDPSTIEVTIK